jgi:hypothetical protein
LANQYPAITAEQAALIAESKLFLVASVAPDLSAGPDGQGAVNVSPKGNVPLRVIDPGTVAYLDYHGSGNETARHAEAGGPITVMVMALEGDDPAIVRLYGQATVEPLESELGRTLLEDGVEEKGLRQVVRIDVSSTATSCGYGVPIFRFEAGRKSSQRGRRFK